MLPQKGRFHLARRPDVFILATGLMASTGIGLGQTVSNCVTCISDVEERGRGLYHGKPIQDWIDALHAGDVNLRQEAALAIDRYDPQGHALVPALFDTLRDPDPEVRRLGARALGVLGNETDLALLLERVRDESAIVRATALKALGPLVAWTGDQCHPKKRMSPVPEPALSALIEGIADDATAARMAALESLQQIGPEAAAAEPRLREMLRDPNVQGPAFLALYNIVGPDEIMNAGAGDVFSSALRVTKDPDWWTRWRAVRALGQFGKLCAQPIPAPGCSDANVNAALRALVGALADTELTVRFGAAESLGASGAKAAGTLASWTEALKRDGDLAIPSAKALDQIGPAARQTVASLLLESLKAPSAVYDDWARTLKALQSLSTDALRAGILIVAESLKHESPVSRHVAASTLGKMGEQAKSAIPALLAALGDPEPSVRIQVSASLEKIGAGTETVPALAMAFRTGEDKSRIAIAELLEKMGHHASVAVPVLIGALDDPSERVRLAAGSALRRIGPESPGLVPSLARQLRDEDPEVRLRSVSVVGAIGPVVSSRLVSELINALEDPDRRIRTYAVQSLGEIARDKEEAIPALARLVRDEDWIVRILACGALGEACTRASAAVPGLVDAVRDPEQSVRSSAISALANCGPAAAPAVPALIEALKDSRKENRQQVLRVLRIIGPKARLATVPLIGLLQSDDEEVQFSARQTLLSVGPDPELAVPAYVEWLKDRSLENRWIPAYALGKFETAAERVADALGWALRDPDPRVRAAAISSLSGLVPKSADSLRVLAGALTDLAPAVRFESVQALTELGPHVAGALPELIRALRDPEAAIRQQAATALGNIGPQAAAAIRALKRAAKDTDPQVRAEATRILGILIAKP